MVYHALMQDNGLWQENAVFQDKVAIDDKGIMIDNPLDSTISPKPDDSTELHQQQVAQLQAQLALLSTKHSDVIASKEELQHHLDQVNEAHNQVKETLAQVQIEAEEKLRAAHEASALAEAESGRHLLEVQARMASALDEVEALTSELGVLQRLQNKTAAELHRWRDMASDLERQIGKKSEEMTAALQRDEQVMK